MFDLKFASQALRAVAKDHGIKEGSYKPVNSGTPVRDLPFDAVIAILYKNGKEIEVTAGDIIEKLGE